MKNPKDRKIISTPHKILTHDQKIEFCKNYLKENNYSKVSENCGCKYPIPDLIAKKGEVTYAVECGSLTDRDKIKDLLNIYDVVIHFYEYKSRLMYLFFKKDSYDLDNFDRELINKEKENERLKREVNILKSDIFNLKRDDGKDIIEVIKILLDQSTSYYDHKNRWFKTRILEKYKNVFCSDNLSIREDESYYKIKEDFGDADDEDDF